MKKPTATAEVATQTVDHQTLLKLRSAGVKLQVVVGFQPGGWRATVMVGKAPCVLEATRARTPRLFKKLETVVTYLQDLGVTAFKVEADGYSADAVVTSRRPDAAQRLKAALLAEPAPASPPVKAPAKKARRKTA